MNDFMWMRTLLSKARLSQEAALALNVSTKAMPPENIRCWRYHKAFSWPLSLVSQARVRPVSKGRDENDNSVSVKEVGANIVLTYLLT